MTTVRTLADLKVGDTAVIAGRDGRGGEVTVVKVARVYITVETLWRGERMFRIDNGREKGDQGIGNPPRLRTPEEAEATSRRDRAVSRLRNAGIDIRWDRQSGFTTKTLEALLAALPPALPMSDEEK